MASTATSSSEIPGGTRDRIVEAALEVFAEKGFEAASTRQIAARVGVNHGLIPYYFGTKQKLWRAAVESAFEEMQDEIGEMLSGAADPRERARRMIRAHVRFVARRPEFVRLMYEEGKRRGERMRWIVDRHVKPLYDAVSEVIEAIPHASRPPGAPQGLSPIHYFYSMAGASGLVFHQAEECRRVSGLDPFDPAFIDAHTAFVEWMLLGPEPTPDPPVEQARESEEENLP